MTINRNTALGNQNQINIKDLLSVLAKIIAGLVIGWFLVSLLQIGLLPSLLMIAAAVLLVTSLDNFKMWLLLMLSVNVSKFMYDVGAFSFRPSHIIFIFLIFGFFLALMGGNIRIHKVPALYPITLLAAMNFISSALYAPDKAWSIQGAVLFSVYMFMYVMTVLVLTEYPEKHKSVVKFIMVIAVAQAAFGLMTFASYYLGIPLGNIAKPALGYSIPRLEGGFQEANVFAGFMAPMALLFIALWTRDNTSFKSWIAIFSTSLLLVGLVLGFTRGAWVGFTVGLIVLIFLQKPPKNIFNPKAAVIALMIVLLVLSITLPIAGVISAGATDDLVDRGYSLLDFGSGSGKERSEVQTFALERWKESKILGRGTMGLPRTIFGAQSWIYSSTIQTLHDTGIVGLGALIWMQLTVLIWLARGYRRETDPFLKAALAGFIAGLIAMIIAWQSSSLMWLGWSWVYLGVTIAIAQSSINRAEAEEVST